MKATKARWSILTCDCIDFDDAQAAIDELNALEAENEQLKETIARNNNGCLCRFEEDGETPMIECSVHAEQRAEVERLQAV